MPFIAIVCYNGGMNTLTLASVFALAASVTATRAPMTIPTYEVGKPDKNPMFFEKRVYQGSCGKVYPVPFIDKVFDERKDKA